MTTGPARQPRLTPTACAVKEALPAEARAAVERVLAQVVDHPTCGLPLLPPLDALRVLRGPPGVRVVYLASRGTPCVLWIGVHPALHAPRAPRAGAVLLAAGPQGSAVLEALRTWLAAPVGSLVLVLGERRSKLLRELAAAERRSMLAKTWSGCRLLLARSSEPRGPVAASLRAGVRLLDVGLDSLLIGLANRPWIRPATIAALLETFRREGPLAVRPHWRGIPGHPVLFAGRLRQELIALQGLGGRDLLDRHGSEVLSLPLDDPGVVRRAGEET